MWTYYRTMFLALPSTLTQYYGMNKTLPLMNITPPDNLTPPSESNICFADLSHLQVYYIFLVGWQVVSLCIVSWVHVLLMCFPYTCYAVGVHCLCGTLHLFQHDQNQGATGSDNHHAIPWWVVKQILSGDVIFSMNGHVFQNEYCIMSSS